METVIAVEDLRKTYQPKTRKSVEVKALEGISFEVPRGEFFGLLGPNGAGKTTTIGILTTRVLPTSGVAQIEGIDVARDPVAVKRRIGVVPQVNNLDRSLTAKEILLFHAEYFGVPKHEREKHMFRDSEVLCMKQQDLFGRKTAIQVEYFGVPKHEREKHAQSLL